MNRTKKELIEEIGTTKGTFYRHMAKLGIDKGKKLSEDDIKSIEMSIKGKSHSTSTGTVELDKVQADLKTELYNKNIEIEKLKKELEEVHIRLKIKENEVNKLQTELTNNVVATNQLSTEHIKLIQEFRLLATPQTQKVPDLEEVQGVRNDTKVDDSNVESMNKNEKKRWWKR